MIESEACQFVRHSPSGDVLEFLNQLRVLKEVLQYFFTAHGHGIRRVVCHWVRGILRVAKGCTRGATAPNLCFAVFR